jgi:hypothetical protein
VEEPSVVKSLLVQTEAFADEIESKPDWKLRWYVSCFKKTAATCKLKYNSDDPEQRKTGIKP